MNKIRILPVNEIKKIAAGEVVDRPANIVKELVENAIDAGAHKIIIYIEEGGKKVVRIVDNGFGMSVDDVELAFDQHATSKITSVDDLQTLHTFGFRGEALSSIASVGEIIINTKAAASDVGVTLTIEFGVISKKEEVACADGTDISISNIFGNIPARKKFLKATDTEWRQILVLFQSFVLAHKNIYFKLFHDGRLVHNCPANDDDKNRVLQLWNKHLVDNMLAIELKDENIKFSCTGLISSHNYARYNTAQIFIFVNGRWVKNYSIVKALIKGYSNIYQQGRYPAAFLFIKIDPTLVDVNIHPRKEEVKFIHAHKIEQLIQKIVNERLNSDAKTSLQESVFSSQIPSYRVDLFSSSRFDEAPSSINFAPQRDLEPLQFMNNSIQSRSANNTFSQINGIKPVMQQTELNVEKYSLIGQLHKTYILLEKDDGLLLIDQHAAHERIFYEIFKKRFEQVETVRLMFPQTVTIDVDDMKLLIKHNHRFAKNGIIGDQMGVNNFVIRSVPVYLKNADLDSLLKEMVNYLQESELLDQDQFDKFITEKMHAQMACKAAVKAGDELSREKMQEIVRQLEQTENRLTCPHGRPTIWFLSLSEIEKKFRRDYI